METFSNTGEGARALLTRRLAIGGLIVTGIATIVSSWLGGDVDAKKKKKKRKSRKKGSSGDGVTIPAHTEVDVEEQAFLKLINDYRAANGRAALALSTQLNTAAARHSMDMGVNGFFSHVNRQGKDVGNRASAAGYPWRVIGENLAAGTGQDTAAEAITMWKSSADHNHNMLDPGYRDIGIGREQVPGSRYEWYWTTVFGKSA